MGFIPFVRKPRSPFEPPSVAYKILSCPILSALTYIHKLLVIIRGDANSRTHDSIRVVCISDSHTSTVTLPPPGDLLVHAGDLTNQGTASEVQAQIDWLSSLSYQHIVFIAGNHDSYFDPRSRAPIDKTRQLDYRNIHYLQHSGTTLTFPQRGGRSLRVYGAPQIPACGGDEMAFQYQRDEDAWSGTISNAANLDILITHTPPKWHLDNYGLGCDYLLREVWRVRPRLHVFGHVHAGRGQEKVFWGKAQEAYERLCFKQGPYKWFSVWLWFDAISMVVYDMTGVAWSRIWGAEVQATVMINASLMDWRTQPAHGPQTVDI